MSAWIELGLFSLIFFVGVPTIAVVIGYAAWKGEPKNSSRDTYFAKFLVAMFCSMFLMVYATQMHARIRSWQSLLQIFCFLLGAFLFGVAGGCMIGIFAYGRGLSPREPTHNPSPNQDV